MLEHLKRSALDDIYYRTYGARLARFTLLARESVEGSWVAQVFEGDNKVYQRDCIREEAAQRAAEYAAFTLAGDKPKTLAWFELRTAWTQRASAALGRLPEGDGAMTLQRRARTRT